MNIAVIGTGYVGLVTGACFADLGNRVICMDKDARKIAKLERGFSPIYEPGLEEIIRRNHKKRLFFTTRLAQAVEPSEVVFIAVSTPQGPSGEADVRQVKAVAHGIARCLNGPKIIVNKSTVPIGMGDLVADILRKNSPPGSVFDVVSNPEFLREGSAVQDLLHPDRVVIGAERREAAQRVAEIYKPLKCPVLLTDLKSAELIKYASNAFLATKISFVNEIALFCEKVGADVQEVVRGMSLDKRIGGAFLNPGLGYGGSCFPKDVAALEAMGRKEKTPFYLLPAVQKANQRQREHFLALGEALLGGFERKKIAVWGLTFKPNTDDLREAPSLTIVPKLVRGKARVAAYDPAVRRPALPAFRKVRFCESPYEAAKEADAVFLLTEWNEFKQIDLEKVRALMKKTVVFRWA